MSNPMEQFTIKPIIPLEVGGVDISFTNSSLFMVLAVVISTFIFGLCLRKRTIIPSVAQSVPETVYEFISSLHRHQEEEMELSAHIPTQRDSCCSGSADCAD